MVFTIQLQIFQLHKNHPEHKIHEKISNTFGEIYSMELTSNDQLYCV